jgi:hypothetical protein
MQQEYSGISAIHPYTTNKPSSNQLVGGSPTTSQQACHGLNKPAQQYTAACALLCTRGDRASAVTRTCTRACQACAYCQISPQAARCCTQRATACVQSYAVCNILHVVAASATISHSTLTCAQGTHEVWHAQTPPPSAPSALASAGCTPNATFGSNTFQSPHTR